jgi:NAD(P)-dependent dehydrogenase (short-subunit alcohol dehydrogenase family)
VNVLRDGLLTGTAMSFAGTGALGRAVAARAAALGASAGGDVIVYDPGDTPMLEALDGAWDVIRPAAATMIEAGGGRILLIAPPPGGAEAAAVRAGLENLARTLSVEWARFAIRPVAILPGSAAGPAEVAELACFLASPAGEYYSGCAFELSGASS